ncbi:MAG: tryptophan synthase subunit alpha, partial [Aquificaceae bacterium]|nr:tryptophan synthase subunit alpha [Aquificaceae bacterium]
MNNLQKLFQREQKLVIPYLLAGYPDIQTSKEAIDIALSLCPAIELGVAFSDPIADGPTLQKAHLKALSNGANLSLTLEIAKEAKAKHPQSSIILMTYLNPIHKLGFSNFTKRAFGAGIDALLIPDLPAEESAPLLRACKEEGISLILLASLSTKEERLKRICELSDPFVYLVS